jgi:minor extracellular serine protease Vpr
VRRSASGRPSGRGRLTRAIPWSVVVLVVGALGVVSSAGAAGKPVTGGAIENLTPAVTPFGMSNAQTTVVVQLSGDPITVADANSKDAGRGALSSAQKDAIRQQLRSQQSPVEQQIRQLGGKVLADYQAAYNGVKVQIAANATSELQSISGVVAVHPVHLVYPSNIHGVPQIGGPQAWDGLNGVHGEGIKIADIDTGIDYTHADFGGPGNPAAYQLALAADTLPADPTLFGPNAPRVKGGTDLVGDNYDPGAKLPDGSLDPAKNTPVPDPNPLDCNGHGTHTAGTAAGSGVLADGSTYTGPYNARTIATHDWNVGPGVAPKADIYSVRVFGCTGATNVVTDAIEWSVDHGMNVINMSLGADFGSPDDPDAVAARNAARDGVIVVSASGNAGPSPYMTSSPGAGPGTLAVAAEDPTQTFPGATINATKGTTTGTFTAINANGFTPLPSQPLNIKVIKDASGNISLGCSAAADGGANSLPPNTAIVVARGTCARVAKAIFGQQAGAAAVIMVNNSGAFPPFEGKITNDPDPPGPPLFGGFDYTVTIPFLGVPGGSNPTTSTNGQKFLALDGGTLTLATATISNPGFAKVASFSSFGPDGSNALKPQVTGPGVSIASAGMGTGNQAVIESGTSMATPHTTGAAALVRQAHASWNSVQAWTTAIENTADPNLLGDYNTVGEGAGLVQVQNAVKTNVVAIGTGGRDALGTVDFGLVTLDRDYTAHQTITLRNFGSTPATFNVTDALDQGSPHTLSINRPTVTVQPGGRQDVNVTLTVPAATAGAALDANGYEFNSVTGLVTFTPASSNDNNGVTLRVPYLLVPQAISHVRIAGVNLGHLKQGSVDVTLRNDRGATTGYDDWFAWGLKDKRDPKSAGLDSDDLLNAGVMSFPSSSQVVFALQTGQRWSNPAEDEFDVLIDVNNDGKPDYDAVAADLGALTAGTNNGEDVVAVFDLRTGKGSIRYFTGADFNGTTMELPVDFSQLCATGSPCVSQTTPISYTVESFGRNGTSDSFGSNATWNVFHPAVSSANFEDAVAPGGTATDTVSVDKAQYQATPQLGVLILSQNNLAHDNNEEALTVPVPAALVH